MPPDEDVVNEGVVKGPPDGEREDEAEVAASRPPDRWKISPTAEGERLDVYLAKVYKTTRSQTSRWIQDGRVTVAGKRAKPGLKLDGGSWLSCEPHEPSQEGRVEPEDGPLDILFEDDQIVVVDKPAELAVHPGAGRPGGTLANRLLAAYPEMAGVGGPGRPGIVHRLDLGTSGVLVAARTVTAQRTLAKAFAERRVCKRYLAVVFGAPREAAGEITAPIARHPQRRKEMTVLLTGRPAETGYRSLAAAQGLSLFELAPVTGRTHQIRVHLKHIGHPIVGDPVYGEARWKEVPKPSQKPVKAFGRPALHAFELEFEHPVSGAPCSFRAPVPKDMLDLWQAATDSPWPE